MKFFVDTADVAEIRELAATGLLDGVTTNPSLVAKTGRDFKETIAEICAVVPGPVSAEVAALDAEGMIREIRQIYDNYPALSTEILAASIRSINHVRDAAIIGADVATIPPSVLKQLVRHPLTDKGIEMFMSDWAKTKQTIG